MNLNNATKAFVALGGNIGNAHATLKAAAHEIARHPQILNVSLSRFYLTSPVSSIPQPDFVNAVSLIETTMDLRTFFGFLQTIETQFGKIPKVKDAPRPIDLDILFFGEKLAMIPI